MQKVGEKVSLVKVISSFSIGNIRFWIQLFISVYRIFLSLSNHTVEKNGNHIEGIMKSPFESLISTCR